MAVTTAERFSLRQLIWACLGVIAVVFVAAPAASITTRIAVGHAVSELGDRLLPMRSKMSDLSRAFINQETGQRGFMLTDNPVTLEQYSTGVTVADRLIPELRNEFTTAPQSEVLLKDLDEVVDAYGTWRSQAADPQILAQRTGSPTPEQVSRMGLEAKTQFENLRQKYRAVTDQIDVLIRGQLGRINSIQHLANILQTAAALVLAAVIFGAVLVVRQQLTKPVGRLVADVRAVADGDYDRTIERAGPREISEVSAAVEEMRDSLRVAAARRVDSELRDEQARIAADLHDRVIQRVFGLGLGLTSAAAHGKRDLTPFIDETDGIIRDLRESIFNLDHSVETTVRVTRLRSAIIDLIDGDMSSLPFTPTLQLDGPIEAIAIPPPIQASVLSVIRESLSNIARHAQATEATVKVVIGDDELRVIVEDNGIGISPDDVLGNGRRNIGARATQFGGRAEIRNGESGVGTVVDWRVPLPARG